MAKPPDPQALPLPSGMPARERPPRMHAGRGARRAPQNGGSRPLFSRSIIQASASCWCAYSGVATSALGCMRRRSPLSVPASISAPAAASRSGAQCPAAPGRAAAKCAGLHGSWRRAVLRRCAAASTAAAAEVRSAALAQGRGRDMRPPARVRRRPGRSVAAGPARTHWRRAGPANPRPRAGSCAPRPPRPPRRRPDCRCAGSPGTPVTRRARSHRPALTGDQRDARRLTTRAATPRGQPWGQCRFNGLVQGTVAPLPLPPMQRWQPLHHQESMCAARVGRRAHQRRAHALNQARRRRAARARASRQRQRHIRAVQAHAGARQGPGHGLLLLGRSVDIPGGSRAARQGPGRAGGAAASGGSVLLLHSRARQRQRGARALRPNTERAARCAHRSSGIVKWLLRGAAAGEAGGWALCQRGSACSGGHLLAWVTSPSR